MLRVVHYINQFFAGLGGEEKADLKPEVRSGPVGPGRLLQSLLQGRGEVVATLICGDTYFAEQPEEACRRLADLLFTLKADLILAGPAFASGRYGLACGEVARTALNELKIPAVAAMHHENPGVQAAAAGAYIVPCGSSAASMKEALPPLVALGIKLAGGSALSPDVDGYLPRGIRKNVTADLPAAVRAVNMVLAKIAGRPFTSEIPLPSSTESHRRLRSSTSARPWLLSSRKVGWSRPATPTESSRPWQVTLPDTPLVVFEVSLPVISSRSTAGTQPISPMPTRID